MSDLIEITLLRDHRVLGRLQAKDVQCMIHQGVADDLINRKIAKLTKTAKDEHKEKRDIKGGE
jgi:hypothetical protein